MKNTNKHIRRKEKSNKINNLVHSKQQKSWKTTSLVKYLAKQRTVSIFVRVSNQDSHSWMEIHRVYNLVQTSGYTQERKSQIRLCQETGRVLEMVKWKLDELVAEWWKRKVWRRIKTAHDLNNITSFVKYGGGSSETESLVFTDDVTADRSKVNC